MALLALLAMAAVIGPAPGNKMELIIYKTGLMSGKKHNVTFDKYQVDYDLKAGRVAVSIEATSIQFHDTWSPAAGKLQEIRDYAVKDALDVAKYPQIKFVSTEVKPTVGDNYDVEGTLTVRGISKPARVKVSRKPDGRFEGAAQILMTDYGIKPPKAALGAVGTKPAMDLTFTLR